tara:strand:+ start:861 stop:1571 length:711 start_codon:yes stop_codon:yes gene_type:complete
MAKKTGPLSTTEKYAVQGMLAEGKSVAEVEEQLGREGGKAVTNYVAGDLDKVLGTVVNARLDRTARGDQTADIPPNEVANDDDGVDSLGSTEPEVSDSGNKVISSKELIERKLSPEKAEKTRVVVDTTMRRETVTLLKSAGMHPDDAEDLFERCENRLLRHPDSSRQMYTYCLRNLNSLDHMVKRAAGGREGVTIMTKTASEIAEASRGRGISADEVGSRTSRNAVFEPKQGRMRK